MILTINAHPKITSFCGSLSESYFKELSNENKAHEILHLHELKFDPILKGYKHDSELEDDLKYAQNLISECNHLVIVSPIWWGSYPALLKGFIDRVFLPGFAFRYRENSNMHEKLLRGKTARLIFTMDAPPWYDLIFYRGSAMNSLKKATLEFSGFNKVKTHRFGSVKNSEKAQRDQWIDDMRKYAREDNKNI